MAADERSRAGFEDGVLRAGRPRAVRADQHDVRVVERGFEVVYAPAAVVHHPDRPDLERRRAQHLKDVAASVGYITLLFRMYGIYIVAFSVLAIAIAA